MSAALQRSDCGLGPDLSDNPDERKRRYENLRTSVAILRSKFRATSLVTSSSSAIQAPFVPYSNYFSLTTTPCATNTNCCSNQIDACSLLESYAMQALRIDCEAKLKEGQEELQKLREKLKDKVRRTELFEYELKKQQKRFEKRISFFSNQAKGLEKRLADQAASQKEELWNHSRLCDIQLKRHEEERQQQNRKMIDDYENIIANLKYLNEEQLGENQRLKRDLDTRLDQMLRFKEENQKQLKYLEEQLKVLAQRAEGFRVKYEEQEKEWNLKLQHTISMHQNQTRALSGDFEMRIEKLKKEMKDERDQQISTLQAYKSQKLEDMEQVEQRVKGVLEAKDAIILKLKHQLMTLQDQVSQSASMLADDDDDNANIEKRHIEH